MGTRRTSYGVETDKLKFGLYDFEMGMAHGSHGVGMDSLKFGNWRGGGCRPHFLQPRATGNFWAWGCRGGGRTRAARTRRPPLPSHARPARRVSRHVSYNVYCATHEHIAYISLVIITVGK